MLSRATAALCVALALLAGSVSRHLLPGAFNDDAAYMALGRALSIGAGYRSIYLAGAPLQVKYPPGLPAVLALLWTVARDPAIVRVLAVAMNVAACGIAAAIVWWIGREQLGVPAVLVAVFAILPFALDPAVQYFTLVLSEPLFLLTTAAALLLYERVRALDQQAAPPRQRAAYALALGLVLAASALVRTQGVALVVAVLAALVVDGMRRRSVVIVAAAALAPLAAWSAWLWAASRGAALASQASEQSYVQFLMNGGIGAALPREVQVVRGNLVDYASLLGAYLAAWPAVRVGAGVVLGLLGGVGTALLTRRARALAFTVIANVVVLLAWPVYQDRFLLPVLPLLGLAVAYGAHALARRTGLDGWRRSGRVALAAAAGVCGVLVLLRQARIRSDAGLARREGRQPMVVSPSFWLPMNAAFVSSVARWATAATQPHDRIAVVAPAGVWLYSGRQTVPMEIVEPRGAPSAFDVAGHYLAAHVLSDSVTVVVVESPYGLTAREVAALRRACPAALTPGDQIGIVNTFRVQPGDACVRAFVARQS